MRRSGSIFASIALSLTLAACVGGSTDTSAEDKERLKVYVLDKAPEDMPVKLGVNFDGKVTLLGAKITPAGVAKAGTQVKVTMYWRADKKLEAGWNLFTHVLDGSGERILNIDNVGPLREWKGDKQVLSPSQWEPGKVYVDEQDFTVPNNLRTDKIQFTTGIWRENDRLKIIGGPADRENRGIVATISTGAPATPATPEPSTRVPALRVNKLDKGVKLTLDGKLDEPAWASAPSTGPFVDVRNGKPAAGFPVSGSVKLLWDEQNLYLGFDVKDPDIVSGFDKKQKDPHLWTKDTVEIMVDPDGDGDNKDYYEIQVNPEGLVFDSQFDDYNSPKKDPDGPFGHQEWEAKLKSGIVVNGTLDKPGDKDEGYVVELAIPWKSFGKAKAAPPKIGDIWRMNFYAMQENNGVAWSAILGQGNFHRASRFGRVMFADKDFVPPVPFGAPGAAPMLLAPPPPPPGPSGSAPPGAMPRLRVAPGIIRTPPPIVPPPPQQPPP
ncbi:MAG: carbohydrate-binding family 9-like protein [Polyangiaceae bacterium]|nr:carbohydrate-binding family 9-like protein [Polyangiaceae bacterium]MCL4752539.1 carbohydrate-binding family 9-like protein [Myxococcales bacterium]